MLIIIIIIKIIIIKIIIIIIIITTTIILKHKEFVYSATAKRSSEIKNFGWPGKYYCEKHQNHSSTKKCSRK